MAYASNLPPGCTAAMIDALCASRFECAGCGGTLDEDEIRECDACSIVFCARCVREVEQGTGYLCENCPEQLEAAYPEAA